MKKNTLLTFWNPPQPPRIPAENYFWSFHLTSPAPSTAYAEVIFWYQQVLFLVGYGGGAPLTVQLGIDNVIGISAGSTLDNQQEIYPFDVTGAGLDYANSAKIGTTSVSVVAGVATLNSLGLYLNAPSTGFLELTGGPQNKANAGTILWSTAGSTVNGAGTWSPKSSWSSLGRLYFGSPSAANPPLAQPSSGEFSK
jgi:hypothetical protein